MVQVKDQTIKTEEMREIQQVWEHSEFSRELKPADNDSLHTCLAYAKLDLLSELMFMVQCSVGTRGSKADSTSLLTSLEDITGGHFCSYFIHSDLSTEIYMKHCAR